MLIPGMLFHNFAKAMIAHSGNAKNQNATVIFLMYSLSSAGSLHLCEEFLFYNVQKIGPKVTWMQQNVMLQRDLKWNTEPFNFQLQH